MKGLRCSRVRCRRIQVNDRGEEAEKDVCQMGMSLQDEVMLPTQIRRGKKVCYHCHDFCPTASPPKLASTRYSSLSCVHHSLHLLRQLYSCPSKRQTASSICLRGPFPLPTWESFFIGSFFETPWRQPLSSDLIFAHRCSSAGYYV